MLDKDTEGSFADDGRLHSKEHDQLMVLEKNGAVKNTEGIKAGYIFSNVLVAALGFL
jgi:hypothetical protein